MTKYTQKQLRQLVVTGKAIDITYADNKKRDEIIAQEGYYTQVGYAAGIYGYNGCLFKGNNTGRLYAITSRSTAIYIFS